MAVPQAPAPRMAKIVDMADTNPAGGATGVFYASCAAGAERGMAESFTIR